jgi:osmoprotectant transport system permease protein
VARYKRLYLPVVSTAGAIYTIPGLAAISFLIGVPHIGLTAWNIIIPLIAYAQLVLIRNIVAAIRAVDPTLVEVGRAMGMNNWQVQWRVTLPLALPVIIAGVRVAAVTTIGIASLASLCGAGGLGDFIFDGIQLGPKHYDEVIAGALLITLMAVTTDLLLLLAQRLLSRGQASIAAV